MTKRKQSDDAKPAADPVKAAGGAISFFDMEYQCSQAEMRAAAIRAIPPKKWDKRTGDLLAVRAEAERLSFAAERIRHFIAAGRPDRAAAFGIALGRAWERTEHAWLIAARIEKSEIAKEATNARKKRAAMKKKLQKRRVAEVVAQIKPKEEFSKHKYFVRAVVDALSLKGTETVQTRVGEIKLTPLQKRSVEEYLAGPKRGSAQRP